MKLPAENSAVMRAVRTTYQVAIAVTGFIYAVTILPGFDTTIAQFYPELVTFLPFITGFLSLIINLVKKDVPNI